jgi:hypothetical protein
MHQLSPIPGQKSAPRKDFDYPISGQWRRIAPLFATAQKRMASAPKNVLRRRTV